MTRPAQTLGATTTVATSLNDAQTQLAIVSAYLTAVGAGTATAAQLQAATAALVVAQADINNANGAAGTPQLPPGTWVQGSAVVAVAAGTGVLGGILGYAARGYFAKQRARVREEEEE